MLRAGAKVVAAVEVNRPEGLDEIATLHIWTAESVRADRLDFRPRHRLTVLVVQASPLAEPVRLARTPEYAGCTSWVPLPVDTGLGGRRCTTTPTLREIAARVRRLSRLTAAAVPRAARSRECRRRRGARCASPAASRRPVISGSPVPRLRANRGCEPPAISTRMRDPARNRCAIASSSMRNGAGIRLSPRRYPSLTLRERPFASTSLIRTNRSL